MSLSNDIAKSRFQSSGTFAGYSNNNIIINGPTCWCPKESQKNQNQWLQLDLGEVKTIHGFETQGHSSHGGHWCKTIRFDTSIDCKKWNREGIFQANVGTDDIKKNKLKEDKHARYVRFYPQKCGGGHGGWGKLRVEVFWTEPLNYIPEEKKNTEEKQERGYNAGEEKIENAKEELIKKQTEGKENQNFEIHLPDPPPIVVTMCTELVRLRGGPYWSESYAILRSPSRVTSSGLPGQPKLTVVDHMTDGGRWILVGSFQSDRPNGIVNRMPEITVGIINKPGYLNTKSYVSNVNSKKCLFLFFCFFPFLFIVLSLMMVIHRTDISFFLYFFGVRFWIFSWC